MRILARQSLLAGLCSLSAVCASHAEALPPVPDLGGRISTFQAQNPPPDAHLQAVMEKAAQDLAAAMPEPGLHVGTRAPDFSLPDAFGKRVSLSGLLADGPVVLTFYRGAWCPYCNLQLRALKESLPHFQAFGAQLVAITPQTPDRSIAQVAEDGYSFPILSDLDDRVMQAYNLYFEVPEELRTLYVEDFSLDITAYNGEGRHGLPVPGTFVIDSRGIIRAAFADTDYRKRMEPAAIIDALSDLSGDSQGMQ